MFRKRFGVWKKTISAFTTTILSTMYSKVSAASSVCSGHYGNSITLFCWSSSDFRSHAHMFVRHVPATKQTQPAFLYHRPGTVAAPVSCSKHQTFSSFFFFLFAKLRWNFRPSLKEVARAEGTEKRVFESRKMAVCRQEKGNPSLAHFGTYAHCTHLRLFAWARNFSFWELPRTPNFFPLFSFWRALLWSISMALPF